MKRIPYIIMAAGTLLFMLALTGLLVTSVVIATREAQNVQTLLFDGKTAAAREARQATAQIRVILCDSLLINRTELKTAQQQHIAIIAEAMIQANCQGVVLPK